MNNLNNINNIVISEEISPQMVASSSEYNVHIVNRVHEVLNQPYQPSENGEENEQKTSFIKKWGTDNKNKLKSYLTASGLLSNEVSLNDNLFDQAY